MKNRYVIYFLLYFQLSFSQTGTWTWMHGSSVMNSAGNYGILGVAAPSNDPPATYESAEWTDKQGNFWLFGGVFSGTTVCSALWKYTPSNNMWTWIKGPSSVNALGVYGVQGIPAMTNMPGARGWGASTWVDQQGNLWLFGGHGFDAVGTYGALSDLWMYDISSNMWTWMKGPNLAAQPGVYGTQGVASPSNYPKAREECSASWSDNKGRLWLFGGLTSIPIFGTMNDLWKYDIGTNEWTWMKGSNTINSPGNYGTIGMSAPTNEPPSRWSYTKWKDVYGNFWLFEGYHKPSASITYTNYCDTWKYDIYTGDWTWMNGSNTPNNPGSFGPLCTFSSTNLPPSRMETRCNWSDNCGNLFMFGGYDYSGWPRNDLWAYNIVNNQWKLISGSTTTNQAGVYGTIGVPSATNIPGARAGALPFTDTAGNFWIFGGQGIGGGKHNDLWRYIPDTTCIKNGGSCAQMPLSNFTGTNLIGCAPLTVTFTNLSQNSTAWLWDFGDGNSSSQQSPIHTYTISGQFTVTLIAINGATSDTTLFSNYVNVNSATASFTQSGNDSICLGQSINFINSSINASSYLWDFGDSNTSTLANPSHSWSAAGSYSVKLIAYNAFNCHDTTIIVYTVIAPAIASFGVLNNDSTCVGSPITFTNTSTGAFNFTWNYGDGNFSNQTSPSHSWSAPGIYTVSLIAEGTLNCNDTASVQCFVIAPAAASFGLSNDSICLGGLISFTNSSSGATGYNWNFGDGNFSLQTNPSYSWSIAGVYTVSLIAKGQYDCNDTTNIQCVVIAPSNASFTMNVDTVCTGMPVIFNNTSSGSSGYNWNFGDGNNSNQINPVHSWSVSGSYQINLIAYGQMNCNDTTTAEIYIVPAPNASFTLPDTVCIGQSVTLTNTSQNATSFVWDFGNSTGSVFTNPVNSWPSAGNYTIQLVAYGPACSDTAKVDISIIPSSVVSFTMDGDSVCINNAVNFTSTIQNTNSFEWNFGDGNNSGSINPSHSWNTSGIYTVTLIGHQFFGCNDSASAVIHVFSNIPPVASFTSNVISGCAPLTVSFTNLSSNASYWYWDFGNGNNSIIKDPSVIYGPGIFSVTLIAINADPICKGSDTLQLLFIEVTDCADTTFLNIPNVFTPNNDGINDLFFIDSRGYFSLELLIYNRWGTLVMMTESIPPVWDGKIVESGAIAPDGTYFYILYANTIKGKHELYKGYITLIR